MRIVVTGAYGFIGSHLVERLLTDGHKVIAFDDMSNGNVANLKNVAGHMGFFPHRLDISSQELRPIVEGTDAFIHLAAITGETQCHNQPMESTLVNVNGTVNVLGTCVAAKVKKFVFVSSAAVYGKQDSLPMVESMALNPTSIYGATKAAGEMYVKSFTKAYGLDAVCIRFANLYGPRRNPAYPVAVMNFARALLDGGRITIFGSGEQSRNFTHVSDAVEGIVLAMAKGRSGEAYNIAARERTTINRLAEIFVGLAEGKKPEVVHTDARVGDRDAFVAISKAREELGFEPKVTLEQGLPEFINWVRENS